MIATYYKPSGKFTPTSLLLFAITSIIALPVLALLYSYCIWYIPFVYINFLITIGFGLGTGLLISNLAIKIGKVRNPMIGFLLGAIGGGIALYFNWAIWVDLVINSSETYGNSRIGVTVSTIEFLQVFSLASQPGVLLEFIKEIGTYGTWGLKGNTVSGGFLYFIWIVEALITIGVAAILPWYKARTPFCELGNCWFTEKELPAFEWIDNPAEVVKDLEAEKPALFSGLTVIDDPEVEGHSIFTVYTSGFGKAYLSIDNKTAKKNKKGEIEFDTDEIVEYITISKSVQETLATK